MSEVQDLFPAMRAVQLDTVERELDNIWRETNTQMAIMGGHGFSRNSVLTLVVYTQSLERARRVIAAVHSLTTQHPSRAIIVAADPNASGHDIQAYVGTYVGADSASYGEDIVLVAQADAVRHLPGVVLPLIVSGLPSFLWWTGEPPWGSTLLETLVDGSDRFVVDTSEMEHVRTSLLALGDLLRRKKSRCAISDMSWAYQSPWREIVAQFFDPPQTRQYLDTIERITIDYAAGDEDSHVNVSQAYLFAGWLVARLSWTVDQIPYGSLDPSRVFTLKSATGRRITLEINALSRLCGDFLPPELAQRVRAANLKDGQLVVLAATPAAAAKLRLLSEGLCQFLSKEGAKVNGVSVRVQPGDARETGAGKPARKLSPQAAGALRRLHHAMADSPAKAALKNLLDHQVKPGAGAAAPAPPPAPPRRGRR